MAARVWQNRRMKVCTLGFRLASIALLSLLALRGDAQEAGQDMSQMDHPHMGHDMSAMEGQPHQPPRRVKSAEEIEANKRFSEFNHHMAGFFVLLVGLLSLVELKISEKLPWARYFWSFLFFIPGVYLLIWSDPESWPTGNQTLSYVIHNNMQVLQHKLFSLLLLLLSAVEFVRIRKRLQSAWVSSIFPLLAGCGALLLLYHDPTAHAGSSPGAHATMMAVQHQHVNFALAGFGIALSKGIADVGKFKPRLFRNLFAVTMVVLAGMLLTYTE
jgi:hypothetical protein